MALEFVEGRSLEAILEAGPLSATAFADVAKPVVSALQAIHAAGVVHRDVKPSNVLVEGGELREGRPHVPPGAVRLMDFGIAGTTLLSRLTVTGTRVGTPVYMSPEQAQGEPMDARSDVYSLGLVFYEMLTGGTAFEGAYETVVHQQVHRTPPPPRQRIVHVPPALDALVMRMIAKDPGDRPDLREVLAVLQDEANWGAGLEVDAPFRLWTVLEVREGAVRTWTPDGRVLAGVADVGPDTLSSVPRDLAVDAHGWAYLLRHERRAVGGGTADHAVVVLDEGGATQGVRVPIGADPGAVARPDRVAVTADGEVRVLDAAGARVVRYAPDGAPAGAFALRDAPHTPATLQATADGGTLVFDPGRRDVIGTPVLIDALGHGEHDARHLLGVDILGGEVALHVAVVAALLRCHPFRDGGHDPGELGHAEIAEHLHVLVDIAGLRATLGDLGYDIRRLAGGDAGRALLVVDDQLHRGAAKAALHRIVGWRVAGRQGGHGGQGHQR
jgi:serine/threonine-protein kinase